MLVTVSFADK